MNIWRINMNKYTVLAYIFTFFGACFLGAISETLLFAFISGGIYGLLLGITSAVYRRYYGV
jgi:hypothetical protein